jgi:hypothetical protein
VPVEKMIPVIMDLWMMRNSVAHWRKFRPHNTKEAAYIYERQGKFAAGFSADLPKKGKKGAELFLKLSFSLKSLDF